jgi:phosphatidylserine/phosphatidylglycerophosphate/cardiolipin synthase-like enzyme
MPEVEVHFLDIRARIQQELRRAKTSINVAIAWFTDEELMAELIDLRSRRPELVIQIVISNALENFRNTHNLGNLIRSGCKLRVSKDDCRFLHHKFCIIDGGTIITGSYNWTYYAANRNEENIAIIRAGIEGDVSRKYQAKFNYYCNDTQTVEFSNEVQTLPSVSLTVSDDLEQIDLRRRFQDRVILNVRKIEEINKAKKPFQKIRVELIHDMIRRYGDGVVMVKKLISDEKVLDENGQLQPKSGFLKLVDWGKQNDLSFESIVVDPEFGSLFTENEISTCRRLLR